MPAMTNAQRQARRLALLNEAAIAAGWTGWRQYETAVITGRAKMNTNNAPAHTVDEIQEYIEQRYAAAAGAVIVDSPRLTHNAADYFRSLHALDTALDEIGYNRDGIEILTAGEWIGKQIAAGSDPALFDMVEGMPKKLLSAAHAAARKFNA